MVWINNQHFNGTVERVVVIDALCLCEECRKERREKEPEPGSCFELDSQKEPV